MSTVTNPLGSPARATIADLLKVEGKAELIDGRVVQFMPTRYLPNRVAFRIARSLDDHAESTGRGVVFTDSMGFAVAELASGRESFSPDASYYAGPIPENPMRFVWVRRRLRWKSVVRRIMDPPQSERSPPRDPITSKLARPSSGMSTRLPGRSENTGRSRRRSRPGSVQARRPMPNRRRPAGVFL